jgi:5-methylcytosine-specific restriction endonuclease McrA
MSRHHVAQQWSTHAPKLRKLIEPQLPLPCVNCGRPVTRDQTWQVGHRHDAALGGRPTIANCGPAHKSCNLKAGGRLGAAITNPGRRAAQDIRPW